MQVFGEVHDDGDVTALAGEAGAAAARQNGRAEAVGGRHRFDHVGVVGGMTTPMGTWR